MTTAWAHLPNAPHIDWVLESLKEHPEVWDAAIDAVWSAARDVAADAAWNAAWNAAIDAVWSAARDAAWNAAKDAAWSAAWEAAWGAIAALIADDDCAHLLLNGVANARVVHALTGHYSPFLLQPAAVAWKQYDTTNRTKTIT